MCKAQKSCHAFAHYALYSHICNDSHRMTVEHMWLEGELLDAHVLHGPPGPGQAFGPSLAAFGRTSMARRSATPGLGRHTLNRCGGGLSSGSLAGS